MNIGWSEKDEVGRVLIRLSKRGDPKAERRVELFCRKIDGDQWLFCDLTESPKQSTVDGVKVQRYLLEQYNLDVEWDGSFWAGDYPF
tara:strand:+ start:2751 stop:3011 length:261 start_codon:yes stop_codon:yes gene_type:complete